MARLEEPSFGMVGWTFTPEEERRGYVEEVVVACSIEDEQQLMEMIQSYEPDALVHAANCYLRRLIIAKNRPVPSDGWEE